MTKLYYHIKRRSLYAILYSGIHNSSAHPETDRQPIVVYYDPADPDGDFQTRLSSEFHDGRFVEMTEDQARVQGFVNKALDNATEGGYNPTTSDPAVEARQLYDYDEDCQLAADICAGDAATDPWTVLESAVERWQQWSRLTSLSFTFTAQADDTVRSVDIDGDGPGRHSSYTIEPPALVKAGQHYEVRLNLRDHTATVAETASPPSV